MSRVSGPDRPLSPVPTSPTDRRHFARATGTAAFRAWAMKAATLVAFLMPKPGVGRRLT